MATEWQNHNKDNAVAVRMADGGDVLNFYQGERWIAKLDMHPGIALADNEKWQLGARIMTVLNDFAKAKQSEDN